MHIIGAGLSGLIAGHYFRQYRPKIYEEQKTLPNNHSALLRFRTDLISRITNIPFKKVTVRKEMIYDSNIIERPNIHMCNMYSYKVTGTITDRSIWNLDPAERYIAPPNFIELLSYGLDIKYDHTFISPAIFSKDVIISTIPMPKLMGKLKYPIGYVFDYRKIWVIKTTINDPKFDVYQTIYYPHLTNPVYRATMCGNELTIECIEKPTELITDIFEETILDFGLPHNIGISKSDLILAEQEYGKIVPISDKVRKDFIYYASQKHNIYSLGRFATWRQILLDDLDKDLGFIQSLIEANSEYSKIAIKSQS